MLGADAMVPPGGFACTACTLANAASAAVCAACGAPRPETAEAAQQSEAMLALQRGGAAALTSLHEHPVRNVTGSREWTCDVCERHFEMGRGARYRCGVCADFDACAECYEQPHGADGVDHALKLVTVDGNGGWFCDECRRWGRPLAEGADATEPLRRFRCYTCADFDLCGECVRQHVRCVPRFDVHPEEAHEDSGSGPVEHLPRATQGVRQGKRAAPEHEIHRQGHRSGALPHPQEAREVHNQKSRCRYRQVPDRALGDDDGDH